MYPLQFTYFTMLRFSCASGSSERLTYRKTQKFRFHPPVKEFVAADSSACFVVELGWIALLTFDNVYVLRLFYSSIRHHQLSQQGHGCAAAFLRH